MYWTDYFWFLGAIAVCSILSLIASSRVKSAFSKYDKVRCISGKTGYDTVKTLMYANDVRDISIGKVGGTLSDHYHPKKKIVNLSDSTYDSNSVAAVAIAAHEMGHVMQKKMGYFFYNIRTALVPIVNFGSYLAMPLVFLGLFLDLYMQVSKPEMGFKIAMVGVVLYGGSLLFALVTLPVELNASRRAKEMLLNNGIISEDEVEGAKAVLSAAAMTYLASLLTSLVYFLRFLLYVLTIFGRRNNNNRR